MYKCKHCGGQGSWYGMAPHKHNIKKTGSIIGSTEVKPKKDWPENFWEDPEAPGCGIFSCPKCNGTGYKQKGRLEPYEEDECPHDQTFENRGILTCQKCSMTYNDQYLMWE